MSSFVESYLLTNGPSLSSDIKAELVNNNNISDVAARQQISRAKGNVAHLKNITFPRNERRARGIPYAYIAWKV